MRERSFEGYTYTDPLDAGFYGRVYRARAPSGEDTLLLEIDEHLASNSEFAGILIARGKLLIKFRHPQVVSTRAVGRAPDGHLVVVTDDVPGRTTIEAVCGTVDTGWEALPAPVAGTVAVALAEVLAAAHERSIVHGALHPRSVVIDAAGMILIDDFAAGRALATWNRRDSVGAFVQGFRSFLAPEMAQGGRPDASTDVYAAAAVISAVMTGSVTGGGKNTLGGAVGGVLARALDTNRLHRYANGKRLRTDLLAAVDADAWPRATAAEVAAFLAGRESRAADALERETEDLLASLGDISSTSPPAELDAIMDSMLAELGDEPAATDGTATPTAGEAQSATPTPLPRAKVPMPTSTPVDTAATPAPRAKVPTPTPMPRGTVPTPTPAPRAKVPTPTPMPRGTVPTPTPMPMPRAKVPTPDSVPDLSRAPSDGGEFSGEAFPPIDTGEAALAALSSLDGGEVAAESPDVGRTSRAASEAAALAALEDILEPAEPAPEGASRSAGPEDRTEAAPLLEPEAARADSEDHTEAMPKLAPESARMGAEDHTEAMPKLGPKDAHADAEDHTEAMPLLEPEDVQAGTEEPEAMLRLAAEGAQAGPEDRTEAAPLLRPEAAPASLEDQTEAMPLLGPEDALAEDWTETAEPEPSGQVRPSSAHASGLEVGAAAPPGARVAVEEVTEPVDLVDDDAATAAAALAALDEPEGGPEERPDTPRGSSIHDDETAGLPLMSTPSSAELERPDPPPLGASRPRVVDTADDTDVVPKMSRPEPAGAVRPRVRPARAESETTNVVDLADLEEVEEVSAVAAAPASAAPAVAAPVVRPAGPATEPSGGPAMPAPAVSSPQGAGAPAAMGAPSTAYAGTSGPAELDGMLPLVPQRRRRVPPVLWGVAILAAVALLIWVVSQQTTLRERAEEEQAAIEAANREKLAEYMAAQPKPGRVYIESQPDAAAVWMLLGRTPLDTTVMNSAALHELRFELDGHKTQDARVLAEHWSGEGESRRASISASLSAGDDADVPAYPPEPPPAAIEGLTQGQGPIHIESNPPGAEVWLLVGITPGVEVGAQAGADYEFKVLKDGYRPGIAVVRAADWTSDDDGDDAAVTRSVTLKRARKRSRR
ncbi:protein kinase domain-containing protein [Haliangium sp.]|uniref:protein kinase domain-containing protein n=1 Tax=Haliangium sp. TaxID=2663208 RepID=UPI003D0FD79B